MICSLTVKLTFFGDFFQTATFFLGCFGPGEKVSKEVTAGIILVCCKLGQHIFQIFVDLESVCFCSLYQAVHDGAGFCSADGIYVDPVLPPEGEGTDGAFCGNLSGLYLWVYRKARPGGTTRRSAPHPVRQRFLRVPEYRDECGRILQSSHLTTKPQRIFYVNKLGFSVIRENYRLGEVIT